MQRIQETDTRFGESFRFVRPGNFEALRQIGGLDGHKNRWRLYPLVVCSTDSVKPMQGRRGWSHERVAKYNRERFVGLVTAGWDLLIIDEAHRLGGSASEWLAISSGKDLFGWSGKPWAPNTRGLHGSE